MLSWCELERPMFIEKEGFSVICALSRRDNKNGENFTVSGYRIFENSFLLIHCKHSASWKPNTKSRCPVNSFQRLAAYMCNIMTRLHLDSLLRQILDYYSDHSYLQNKKKPSKVEISEWQKEFYNKYIVKILAPSGEHLVTGMNLQRLHEKGPKVHHKKACFSFLACSNVYYSF